MPALESLTLKDIRSAKEKRLSSIMIALAIMGWVGLAATIVGILYAIPVALLILVAHALLVAGFRGNAVRLSEQQLPELYARVVAISRRLGLAKVPDVYVVQAGGALNAFATRLLSRDFVVIFSDLVDACGDDDKALDFVLGHEIGHLALGHVKRLFWLAPARLVPLLGPAYSRACEYSCDLAGLAVVADLDAASRGLAVLAAGGRLARQVSLPALRAQAADVAGFWPAILELNLSHPFTSKRLLALQNFVEPQSARAPGRSVFAYLLAPILGLPAAGASGGGALAGVIMMVAMVGMLSAIAIPNFMKFQARAKQGAAMAALASCHEAQLAHFRAHERWATTFDELQLKASVAPYTLCMGDARLGPELATLNADLQGYADAERGFACVAAANLDADDQLDIWFVDEKHAKARQLSDDINDKWLEIEEDPATPPPAVEPPPPAAAAEAAPPPPEPVAVETAKAPVRDTAKPAKRARGKRDKARAP